jgi:ribose/xylose/arabinose/galactoside ABC-type transport system permease subunit
MGYSDVPWFQLTWYLLWLYTGLTILIMLKRSDFVNLTICTTALFMMYNTDRISRSIFRVLVLGIIISLAYDLLWFFLKHSEFAEDSKADGGMEASLRKFVLMLSYVSFILRVRIFVK